MHGLAIGFLYYFYRTQALPSRLLRLAIGLQLGGAFGNLVDRLRAGAVVDFIDVGAWPVFNLADSAIVVGMIGLMWTFATTREGGTPNLEPAADGVSVPVASGEEGTLSGELERASAADDNVPERRGNPWE